MAGELIRDFLKTNEIAPNRLGASLAAAEYRADKTRRGFQPMRLTPEQRVEVFKLANAMQLGVLVAGQEVFGKGSMGLWLYRREVVNGRNP